jgi:hypothetical protein
MDSDDHDPWRVLRALRTWGPRRWTVAVVAAVATMLLLGLPSDLVPNPVFGRQIAAPGWAWPVLVATAALSGLLVATYVREGDRLEELDRPGRRGVAGGVVGFFAVGCPVCNKIVVLALGYTGAVRWFEPVQPLLAVLGLALLTWALHQRLTSATACPVPATPQPTYSEGEV